MSDANEPVSLKKGGNTTLAAAAEQVGLTKEQIAAIDEIGFGLGWDVRTTTGADFDLDASAIVCAGQTVISRGHFVFFHNLTSPDGAVAHSGDNLTGAGDGVDEEIKVKTLGLPPEADKVVFVVNIYDAVTRNQTFGQVRNAFVQATDVNTGAVLLRYDLGEDYSTETAVVFGELYKHTDGSWKFRAIGQGHAEFAALVKEYGVNV